MNTKNELLARLGDRSAVIGIVGLGYVGLPLALRFAEAGFTVLGFDIDPDKPAQIARGESYYRHIPARRVAAAVAAGFSATSDYARAGAADALIICVPTPLKEHREPDLAYITGTMESLAPQLRAGQVVSLESTTYPGTTEEELLPRIERTGLAVGEDCFLVYSPEREDPGNPDYSTATIPKLVSGATAACLEVGESLYSGVIDRVVPVSSTRAAEMTKLLENIHRAVNIGLVNEMKTVADRMGIDIYEVIDAAATKPFGFVPYYPGPGLGGHCIPIDPFYLTWKAREYGINTRFIELAGEVNSAMPAWVIGKLTGALNQRGKAVRGSRILMLGIAYKKNVDDVRESPSVEIMQQLSDLGAQVEYCDPHFPEFPKMRRYHFDLRSRELRADMLADFDCVVIGVDHDCFDYDMLVQNASLIVDTRGRLRDRNGRVVAA